MWHVRGTSCGNSRLSDPRMLASPCKTVKAHRDSSSASQHRAHCCPGRNSDARDWQVSSERATELMPWSDVQRWQLGGDCKGNSRLEDRIFDVSEAGLMVGNSDCELVSSVEHRCLKMISVTGVSVFDPNATPSQSSKSSWGPPVVARFVSQEALRKGVALAEVPAEQPLRGVPAFQSSLLACVEVLVGGRAGAREATRPSQAPAARRHRKTPSF